MGPPYRACPTDTALRNGTGFDSRIKQRFILLLCSYLYGFRPNVVQPSVGRVCCESGVPSLFGQYTDNGIGQFLVTVQRDSFCHFFGSRFSFMFFYSAPGGGMAFERVGMLVDLMLSATWKAEPES